MTTSDLADFIQQHATPHDPATDTYRRSPFARPVKAKRSGAIYNAHTYHTKVPPEGIVPYIEHYTSPGALILDPFCGSGMTGVAALMTGRHAILNDLSPAAVHIARNYTTRVDVAALRREFERIKIAVKEEFDWLHGTICDRCGGPAIIQYTIWSDVFECGRCGGEIVLWNVAIENGKVREQFTCPTCKSNWRKIDLHWVHYEPVLTNYECINCNPRRGEHHTTESEKQRVMEIEAETMPYWYPVDTFNQSWEMWRGAHGEQNVTDVSKFFTPRNLRASARLWKEFNVGHDKRLKQALQFIFTTFILKHATRMTSIILKGGHKPILTGNQPGTLYIPSFSVEKNILELAQRKAEDILKAFIEVTSYIHNSDVFTRVGTATKLTEISNNMVDYVFTDPPFGSNIFYADCNFIWESWLNQGLTDQSQEAVVHVKHKDKNTLPDYAHLMTQAFTEMYRVLKPGRWASVVFHNSDDRIWQAILDAAEAAGFELAEINAFDKQQLSFKGIKGAKGEERVTNQDIVLNLRKPRPVEAARPNGRSDTVEVEQRIVERVADFLAVGPPPEQRTLQYLWNRVLYDMLREGSVETSMAGVEAMLADHYRTFKLVDGRYYLRGEAVLGGNVFDLGSDAGAIAWLTALLTGEPQTTGDLIPKWQRETANPATSSRSGPGSADPGRLDRLLAENFWQDKRTGRWRLPTPAERDQMSARAGLSDQAHLRVIRRYLAGELERRPGDPELVAWVRFCYGREFFSEAAQLFPRINEGRLDPDEYRAIKRMATVSKLRAGE